MNEQPANDYEFDMLGRMQNSNVHLSTGNIMLVDVRLSNLLNLWEYSGV